MAIKVGGATVWFDKWTKQGALYYRVEDKAMDKQPKVKDFIVDGIEKR